MLKSNFSHGGASNDTLYTLYTCIVVLFGGKTFVVFVAEHLSTNILPTNEAIIDYLYLQCKQQPRITD